MQFEHLSIRNFLSIGEADVKLADRGRLLGQGRYLESAGASGYGAGKSTQVDSSSCVLYGNTARGVTTDDVLSDLAGKNCSVELTIKGGDDEYGVTRHRKHSKDE